MRGGRILQGDERVGRRAPHHRLIGRTRPYLGGEDAIPEIVEQQETVVEVLGVNARHRQAGGLQRTRDRNERAHILGQVREAAVGKSVADDRTIGLPLPIHEDRAWPRAAGDAPIAAHRGVALQILQLAVVGLIDDCAHGGKARQARGPIAMTSERHAPRCAAVAIVETHNEPVRRQLIAGLLGPFDDGNAVAERQIEAELFQLGGRAQSVEIEMRHRHARRRIALHQRERRARYLLALVAGQRLDDGTCQRRLAGAEIAAQSQQVAAPRDERKLLTQAHQLGLTETVDDVGSGVCGHALSLLGGAATGR